jgi:hypothetical protein
MDITADAPFVEGNHFQQGTHTAPDGRTLTLNNCFLRLNGAPIFPISGEFHYTRYPRAEWEEALLKMKASGIQIIAAYCFWSHHQEEKGRILFDGNLDVRHLIALCARHGLYAFLRLGPWCHGECRYGGLPDWFVDEFGADRGALFEPGGVYWAHYERWYKALAEQFAGLYFKDGGPIIGIQVDNEVPAKNADAPGYRYMIALKRLALDCGIDVPFYTVTGWNGVAPEDELMPTYGAYPEAPWEGHTRELEPSTCFLFRKVRHDPIIGSDLGLGAPALGGVGDAVNRHPYLTVEMGGGNQITYHRRPRIAAADVIAPVYVRLGMGANSMGYYIYHGSQHPLSSEGAHPTQESRATGYPNDYPMISYDFQAPLTEWGFVRDSFHDFKLIHLFLADFGGLLAPMHPHFPPSNPADSGDTQTLRYAVRSRGGAGFIFINNHVRHLRMADHSNVRLTLSLPGERLTIPAEGGFEIQDGVYAIMPFNLMLGATLLKYATAHPVCMLDNEKLSVFFYAPRGIRPEYQFDASTLCDMTVANGEVVSADGFIKVDALKPGRDCVIRFSDTSGRLIEIITLTEDDARHAYKAVLAGRECLLLTDRALMFWPDNSKIEALSLGENRFDIAVYPHLLISGAHRRDKALADGVFTVYDLATQAWEARQPSIKLKTDMAAFDQYCRGLKRTPAGPSYSHRFDPRTQNLVFEIEWPKGLLDGVHDVLAEFDYVGNTAQVYANEILIADDYYSGKTMPFGARRHAEALGSSSFLLELTPMMPDPEIYFEPDTDIGFAQTTHAELRGVRLTPEYRFTLDVLS